MEGKRHCRELPREQWRFLKKEAHPGYITWDQFLANEQRLLQNQPAHGGGERKAGPAREGPALLQGLVLCGKCGSAMTVRYHQRSGRLTPDYVCQKECIERAQDVCQRIPGGGLDEAVGQLLVQSVTPLAPEVALNVQSEIQAQLAEADRLRQQQLQRAQYEADRAQIRFMRVDPSNRLVADTLEGQWNEKLRVLHQVAEECQKQHQLDSAHLSQEQKARILALASEFPRLWHDSQTPDRDRKRMARLLLEDVTLRRETEQISAQLRFKGGLTREVRLPVPKAAWALRKTKSEIVTEIDRMLDHHSVREIVQQLNERGWHSSTGQPFSSHIILRLQRSHRLKSRRQRLREQGWLTVYEIANLLRCKGGRIGYWRNAGLLESIKVSDKNDRLYRKPSEAVAAEIMRRQRRPDNTHNSQPSQLGVV